MVANEVARAERIRGCFEHFDVSALADFGQKIVNVLPFCIVGRFHDAERNRPERWSGSGETT